MHLVMAGVTAPSHVYPSLTLISELVSRGHRVSYVLGERLTGLVTPTGAEVLAHPSLRPDDDSSGWFDDVGAAMQLFLDEAISVLDPMLDRIERPDAVLYDIGGFAGRVCRRAMGRARRAALAYVCGLGRVRAGHRGAESIAERPALLRNLACLAGRNDVELDADAFLGRPDACVVLIPRVLPPNADRVGPQYVFAAGNRS
jgi:hypothetical protein